MNKETQTEPTEAGLDTDISARPGSILKDARLKADIEISEVAKVLHLEEFLLEALEADDYDNLPEPTFVKGYLRGYARFLQLPAEPVIEAYEKHGFDAPEVVADIGIGQQAKSDDASVQLVTYGVVVALIVLMVIWWQTQNSESPEATLVVADSPVAENEPSAEPSASMQQPEPVESLVSAPESLETAQDSGGGDSVLSAASTDGQVSGDTAVAEVKVGEAVTELAELPEVTKVPVSEDVTVSVEPNAEVGLNTLVMSFQHDAWVEVYARDNKRLFLQTARAGRTVSLQGLEPIRVLIGYAQGVEVEYNGKPFDIQPYTSKQIARFTLGENAQLVE